MKSPKKLLGKWHFSKSSPRLKHPKAHWRKWHYPHNLYAFKVQTMENILAQTAAPQVSEWASYGNYRKVTQNMHFLKQRAKLGPREIFQKSPKN